MAIVPAPSTRAELFAEQRFPTGFYATHDDAEEVPDTLVKWQECGKCLIL